MDGRYYFLDRRLFYIQSGRGIKFRRASTLDDHEDHNIGGGGHGIKGQAVSDLQTVITHYLVA